MKTALTIAGSDSSGGAGIQADLKTMMAHGVFGMSAVTALTAQNTMGVSAVSESTPEFLAAQIDSVFSDIPPDAVKVGMVSSSALIEVIAERMERYRVQKLVVDPVMVATSGARLLDDAALGTLKEKLLPLATVITPNLREAEVLLGRPVEGREGMERGAADLFAMFGCAVLCKGGHSPKNADDLLYRGKGMRWLEAERVANPNTHGTGCTLSSAIASNLALGYDLETAVEKAKAYVHEALSAMLDLGRGSGPLNHACRFSFGEVMS